MSSFSPAFFDPSNPALFNFNSDLLDFSNQYGALEFGMLGHMASGTAETPPRDPSISQHSQQGTSDVNFGSTAGLLGSGGGSISQTFDNNNIMGYNFGMGSSANGMYAQDNLQHGLPHAFAIPAGPTSLQSPSVETDSPQPFNIDESPSTGNFTTLPVSGPGPQGQATTGAVHSRSGRPGKPTAIPRPFPASILGSKRTRDSSYVYDRVTEPYTYVNAFHTLIALLKDRFSSTKILRIAKALASIRPSFISCTRTLNRTDLIFMEKCFQRMLLEYEDFMLQSSAPTIVCRRTGEVAAVNKEFIALTGWTKGVLLGTEPNLNANTGGAGSANASGHAGLNTPRLKAEIDDVDEKQRPNSIEDKEGVASKSRPIFIAELMDDDSVIDFYNDYASLAFGDSRGHVTRKCRLLKYRPEQNLDSATGETGDDGDNNMTPIKGAGAASSKQRNSILSSRVTRIDGEHGISRFAKDGKLECSYTWTIKRDTFDIPMMIVINVSISLLRKLLRLFTRATRLTLDVVPSLLLS
jgi:PAS domain-containing protein